MGLCFGFCRDCCDTVTEVIIFLPAKRSSSAVSHEMSKRFPCRSWSECDDPSQSEQMVVNLHGHVTGMTRRETGGSKCKLFIKEHGQYRQGRAGANRYGMGKTQE